MQTDCTGFSDTPILYFQVLIKRAVHIYQLADVPTFIFPHLISPTRLQDPFRALGTTAFLRISWLFLPAQISLLPLTLISPPNYTKISPWKKSSQFLSLIYSSDSTVSPASFSSDSYFFCLVIIVYLSRLGVFHFHIPVDSKTTHYFS